MTTSDPDDLSPELLAAYVDGELGPRDRTRVELWLADHPEARNLVEDQESLGPRNTDFWQVASPPEPSHRQWADVLDAIRGRSSILTPRRWLPWAGSLALAAAATAATVLFVLASNPVHLGPDIGPAILDSAEPEEEPLAIASTDEVRIISLPESAARFLVVGEHPLRDSLVILARADEIEFLGVNTDSFGRFPEMPFEVAPEDAPMIWAPKDP